jgi:hypothetical protein
MDRMHTQNNEPTNTRATVAALRYDFEAEPEGQRQQQTTTVRIVDIATRDDWQVRDGVSEHLVRAYATHYVHGADMPPIRLANIGGALVLVDGWHRLLAQRKLGREEVEAYVDELGEEEAQWEAALANTRNGARLKSQNEKHRVFKLYMRQGRNRVGLRGLKSYREIARDLGGLASKSSIENWMKKSFPKVAAKMRSGREDNAGGDGDLKARLRGAEWRMQEALRQAAAEARGVPCLGKRLALVREFSKSVLGATAWSPEAIEINPDF